MIVVGNNWMFLHNPRTSGTSIIVYLKQNHDVTIVPSSKYSEIEDDDYADYYKFGFVRNPYQREFSLFVNKINAIGTKEQFKEFVFNSDYDHYRKQYEYFTDHTGQIAFNTFKFEERKKGLREVCKHTDITFGGIITHELYKNSCRDTSVYRDYFDEEMLEHLSRIYQRDLMLFEYEF